jgi:hypothetical protein
MKLFSLKGFAVALLEFWGQHTYRRLLIYHGLS